MASIAEKTGINIHTIKRIKNFNSNFSEKTLQAFLKAYPMLDFNSFSSRIYRRGVTHKVKVADIFDFIIEERVFNEEKNSLSSWGHSFKSVLLCFVFGFFCVDVFVFYGAFGMMSRENKKDLFMEMFEVLKNLQIAFTENKNIYACYFDRKDGAEAVLITKNKVIELLKEEMSFFKGKSFNEINKLLTEYHKIYLNIVHNLPEGDVCVYLNKEGGLNKYFEGGV